MTLTVLGRGGEGRGGIREEATSGIPGMSLTPYQRPHVILLAEKYSPRGITHDKFHGEQNAACSGHPGFGRDARSMVIYDYDIEYYKYTPPQPRKHLHKRQRPSSWTTFSDSRAENNSVRFTVTNMPPIMETHPIQTCWNILTSVSSFVRYILRKK